MWDQISNLTVSHHETGPDGDITHYTDGSHTITNPQGFMTWHHADGSVHQVNPDTSQSGYHE